MSVATDLPLAPRIRISYRLHLSEAPVLHSRLHMHAHQLVHIWVVRFLKFRSWWGYDRPYPRACQLLRPLLTPPRGAHVYRLGVPLQLIALHGPPSVDVADQVFQFVLSRQRLLLLSLAANQLVELVGKLLLLLLLPRGRCKGRQLESVLAHGLEGLAAQDLGGVLPHLVGVFLGLKGIDQNRRDSLRRRQAW